MEIYILGQGEYVRFSAQPVKGQEVGQSQSEKAC